MNFKASEPHCHNRRMLPLCSQGKKQQGALSKSYLLCLSYQERPERSMASRIDFLTVHRSVSSIPLTFSPPVFSHFFSSSTCNLLVSSSVPSFYFSPSFRLGVCSCSPSGSQTSGREKNREIPSDVFYFHFPTFLRGTDSIAACW